MKLVSCSEILRTNARTERSSFYSLIVVYFQEASYCMAVTSSIPVLCFVFSLYSSSILSVVMLIPRKVYVFVLADSLCLISIWKIEMCEYM